MFKWQLKKYQVPDMIVQNCSTQVAKGTMKEYDIMVWAASVIQYKNLGYKVKLYCATEDIPNLKKYHLYELYDEVDTKVYDNCAKDLKGVNLEQFWSAKKLIALKDAFKHRKNVIYSDTDIIMHKLASTSVNFMFWCTEPNNLYDIPAWHDISAPKYYNYPKYLFNSTGAYNCGIMKMNDYRIFKKYYKQYFKFIKHNPCIVPPSIIENRANNFYACTAEQRLLKALLDSHNIKTFCLSNWNDSGICDNGIHIFVLKQVWLLDQKHYGKIVEQSSQYEHFINIKNLSLAIIKDYCDLIKDDTLLTFINSLSFIKNNEVIYK